MTDEQLQQVLGYGIMAPSGDNAQPWKFYRCDGGVELHLDLARKIVFWDEGCRALYISAGALIENVRVACAALGYGCNVEYTLTPHEPHKVARLTFAPAFSGNAEDLKVLGERLTNRKFHDFRRAVPDQVLEEARRVYEGEAGFDLRWVRRGEKRYGPLARLVGRFDQIRFENRDIHQTLIDGIRLNRRSVEATRDGLDIETLELDPVMRRLLPLMLPWERMRVLNWFGMSFNFGMYGTLQMHSSSAMGIMTAPGRSAYDFVRGGELVQRAWHALTRHGVAVQPMTTIAMFVNNTVAGQNEVLTAVQRARLEGLMGQFYGQFTPGELPREKGLVFILRAGYAAPVRVRSLRRSEATFIN